MVQGARGIQGRDRLGVPTEREYTENQDYYRTGALFTELAERKLVQVLAQS